MDNEATLRKLFHEADQLAERILIAKARATMRRAPTLTEFVIGMGTWFFVDRDGAYLDGDCSLVCVQRFADFIDRWNPHFYLTGGAMRFTVDGPVVRDW